MKLFSIPGFLLACILLTAKPLAAQLPADSLKACYTFDGNLLDNSGEGNHITQFSGTYTHDRFAQPTSAFLLNGQSDSLVLPVAEFAPITGDFTISLWYKTNWPQVMNLFSSKQFPTDTSANFEVQLNSHSQFNLQSNPQVWYQTYLYWNGTGVSGNALAEGAPGPYTKGEWCHFVLTREADTMRLYRNHILHTWSIDHWVSGNLGDALSLVFSAAPYRFKGVIDDLRLYNRALRPEEVDLLWFENRPFVFTDPKPTDAYVPGSQLLANWQYDTSQVGDSIRVDYRINSGPWQNAVHSGLAYEYFIQLQLNYPAGTRIEIRVTDREDSTKTASSGEFIISEYDWVEVAPALPWNSKDGAGLLSFDNKMWILGGWDPPYHPPTYTHNEVWSSTDGANWTFEGNAPWPARHCSGWLVYDSALWVIGGDPQSGCLRDVWRSADGVTWVQTEDTIPGYLLRHNANYAPLPDKMLMMGGTSCGVYPQTVYNEVWESPDGITWTRLPDAPWTGRGMQINYCVDDSGAVWILGGAGEHDRRSYNDVWKTRDGVQWTLVNASAPWASRNWHTTAWFDGKIWVVAGAATGTEVNDVWYSEDGITWHELKSTTGNWPQGTRHAHSTTVYDHALWYMCGISTNSAWKIINTTLTAIEEIQPDKTSFLNVYPNPANEQVTLVAGSDMVDKVYTLYDQTGRILNTGIILQEKTIVPLHGIPPGLYLLGVDGEKSWVKLVKTR